MSHAANENIFISKSLSNRVTKKNIASQLQDTASAIVKAGKDDITCKVYMEKDRALTCKLVSYKKTHKKDRLIQHIKLNGSLDILHDIIELEIKAIELNLNKLQKKHLDITTVVSIKVSNLKEDNFLLKLSFY